MIQEYSSHETDKTQRESLNSFLSGYVASPDKFTLQNVATDSVL